MMKKILLFTFLISGLIANGQSKIVTDTVNTEYIPYGVRSLNARVESTSSVNGEKLASAASPNLIQSLYGMFPGVYIAHSSSEPGEENTEIFIRGKASLLENIPLILVDGIETSYQQINWTEVETVTVLKDAPALAVYGFRGANGVLMINTRRGTSTGKPVITLNARYGSQSPISLPQFASSADYMTLYNEARVNDGLTPVFLQERIDGTQNKVDPYLYPDVNWRDEVFKANAPVSEYNLTFKGGNNAVRYFLMLGYLNNQGLYKDTDPARDNNSNINYDRFSFRSNIDVNVSKELTVSLDISGRVFQKIQPNVNINDHSKAMNTMTFFPVMTPGEYWAGRQGEISNPKAAILEGGYRSYHSREINETLRLHYDLSKVVPGLGVFGTVAFSSWFKTNYDKTRQFPYYEVNLKPGTTPGTEDVAYDYVMRGNYTDRTISQGTYWQWNRYNIEGGIDYNRNIDDHSIDGMLIFHQNLYRANGVHTPYAQQRLMARVHYGFKNTYFLEFSSALSGSDNYRPGERFGFFPAAGLSWVASNESFLQDNPVVTYLKVNASTGLTGSDRIGSTGRWGYEQYYSYGTGITVGGETTTGLSNLVEGRLPNLDLTWEKAMKSNVAVEANLLNKVDLKVDLFYEKRDDILVAASGTRPSYMGVTLPFVNEGITENKGIELSVGYADKIGDLKYQIGANLSYITSNVINKNEEPRADDYRRETGYPIGTIFGLEHIGFFSDENDIKNSPTQLFGANKPGDLKYRDLNEDAVIDELDMKAIGYSVIPDLLYVVSGALSYSGFDMSFLVQGSGNRSLVLNGNMVKPFVDNARITPWAAEGRWTAATAATATYPRLSTLDNSNNYRTSTFWLRNGSFLRLKNIEFGYTIPAYLTESVKIEQCRFYISGNNLLTKQYISDVSIDAESFDINKYPLVKTVNVGVNLTF